MTPRRQMALALGLVVTGGVVALLGGGPSSGATPGVPPAPGTSTGTGAATALALVGLAGAGATLLLRNRARIVLAAVLVAVAAALVAAGLGPLRWAALVGGVLIAVGAVTTVLLARGWPQPRSRYDPPASRLADNPRATWDALDRGEDPTA